MIKNFIIAIIIYLILDAVWLGIFMKGFYFKSFGDLARKDENSLKPNLLASALSYIVLALGIALIIIPNTHSLGKAILFGAIFGLVVYGVYDFTNMATLNGWTWKLSFVDLLWGTFVSSAVAAGTYFVGNL